MAVELPVEYAVVLDGYITALVSAPLSAQTRRTYASKVRQFLAWLAGAKSTAIRSAASVGGIGR